MNRYENPSVPPAPRPPFTARIVAPFAPVLAVLLLTALFGRLTGVDWMDRPIKALIHLHAAGLGMDLYTLAAARWCRRRGGRVVIPYAAPAIFGSVRLILYGACREKFLAAGALYAVSSTGFMIPRTGPLIAVGAFALLSLALTIYEGIMVRTALCPAEEKLRRAEAPPTDVPVGPEYAYEAQTILRALGYYAGPVDGALTVEVKESVKRFQGEAGLMAHGGLTAATIIELRRRWEMYQIRALQRPGEGMEKGNGRGMWTRIQDWLK